MARSKIIGQKAIGVIGIVLSFAACNTNPSNPSLPNGGEDVSPGSLAAAVFGGAIAGSASNGTFSVALTAATCPTLATSGSGCSATSNVATLTDASCSYTGSSAVWNGYRRVSFSGTTTLTCGSFPSPTSDTLQRQYVTSGGTAGAATMTNAAGTVVTVDDTTSGINGNYQGDTFDGSGASQVQFPAFNSGGGKLVNFVGSARVSVQILEHVSATGLDQTIAGTLALNESGTGSSMTWAASVGTVTSGSCSGGITVYDNSAKVMGTTCFQAVTYNAACCTPVSGNIITTYSTTSQSSGAASAQLNGRTERLSFNGCGLAVKTDTSGLDSLVGVSHCL